MAYATIIKELRKNAGLTLSKAADIVHVETRAWQFWESGHRQCPINIIELFCLKTKQDFFDVEKKINRLNMNFVKFENLNIETMVNDAFSYNSFTIELEKEYLESAENVKKALENIYTLDNQYTFIKEHPSFPEEIVTRFDAKNKKHQKHLRDIASEVFSKLHSDDNN